MLKFKNNKGNKKASGKNTKYQKHLWVFQLSEEGEIKKMKLYCRSERVIIFSGFSFFICTKCRFCGFSWLDCGFFPFLMWFTLSEYIELWIIAPFLFYIQTLSAVQDWMGFEVRQQLQNRSHPAFICINFDRSLTFLSEFMKFTVSTGIHKIPTRRGWQVSCKIWELCMQRFPPAAASVFTWSRFSLVDTTNTRISEAFKFTYCF